MKASDKSLVLMAGIICLVALHYAWNPFGFDAKVLKGFSMGLLMISFWILEVLPMPVVALFPLVFFPLWNLADLKEVSKHYADPVIFLFMGGFFIALAIQKWNLHQRIALNILKWSGSNGNQILLGFILATFLISMWLSNTATTMMMYPIALSVIQVLGQSESETNLKPLSLSILLSIAYASNFGGLATIVGTPPNVAFIGFMNERMQFGISFWQWFMIGFPVALTMALLMYVLFTRLLYRNQIRKNIETEQYILRELEGLGPWSMAEKRVFVIFTGTAFLWMSKDLWVRFLSLPLNDTVIALLGALALFVVPSGAHKQQEDSADKEEKSHNRLLEWDDTRNMAWGILLLFGGGLALAKTWEDVGIMEMIGRGIGAHAPSNTFLLMLLVAAVSVYLSEIMSNVAQVIVMAPILASVALAMGIPPIWIGLPMTFAASCAGMLPMGTPPNAIIYSSNKVPLRQMIRAGGILNLVSILVISSLCYFLVEYVFRSVG
ncbi:MAG TPA: SLC13 family permease [Saprospiraceae bacterium]|nr:SLC13 family permease [Saprospiraceae bacterium]